MVARSLFIGVVVASVLVASSNRVLGAPAEMDQDIAHISQLFEVVDEAIESSGDTQSDQAEEANNTDNLLCKHTYRRVLPSDVSIHTSGWNVTALLVAEKHYAKNAMDQSLIDDILRSFETATDDEEFHTLSTLGNLISRGYYRREDSGFLREKIIPVLNSRLSHGYYAIASRAAISLYDIVRDNHVSVSQHLIESGVARRVIQQIGTRLQCGDLKFDLNLLYIIDSIASKVPPQYKSELAKLDILSRINASFKDHSVSRKDIDTILEVSLTMMSKLVSGNVDATDSLIEQGLPELINEGLTSYSRCKDMAVQILYDIMQLNKPKQMGAFRKHPSIKCKLESYYYSQINRLSYRDDGYRDTHKFAKILSALNNLN